MPRSSTDILGIAVSGRLTDEDYEKWTPRILGFLKEEGGKRLLMRLDGFAGWTAKALWDDFETAVRHARVFNENTDRVAIVTQDTKDELLALLAKPFTAATVRRFADSELDDAWAWLREGMEPGFGH
jgi:universal stress protein A